MVLVVLPNLDNTFFSKILRGIEETLFEAGYGMIIGDLDGSPEKEAHFAAFAGGRPGRRRAPAERASVRAEPRRARACVRIERSAGRSVRGDPRRGHSADRGRQPRRPPGG